MATALWIIAISEIVMAVGAVVMAVTNRRHYVLSKDRIEAANIAEMEHLRIRAKELRLADERNAAIKKAWGASDSESP